jgi:hypothetical protein
MPYGSSSGVSVGPTMVNMQARGADMSGAVAADAIWTAALAELPNNSGEIYIPPGILKTHTTFEGPAQSTGFLRIRGAGRTATKIIPDASMDHVMSLRMPGEVEDLTVDGNALATGSCLAMTTGGSIAISSMAARRVSVGNNAPTGIWTLLVWDTAQIYQIDKVWLDDVWLYGPTNIANDSFTVSYIKHLFVKNMVCDGIGRGNFFAARDIDVDGLRVVNSLATYGIIFDALLDRVRVSHLFCDSTGQGVTINCGNAKFLECEIQNQIYLNLGNQLLPHISFHQCNVELGMNLYSGSIESIEIVGGEWGQKAVYPAAVITDLTPANTNHRMIRLFDVILGNAYVINAFNPTTIVDELVVSNCSGWNPGRVLNDATVNGTTTLTSPTARFVSGLDVGRSVIDFGSGNKIPAGTTIASVTNATTAIMSAAATGSFTPDQVALGGYAVTMNNPITNGMTIGAKSRIRGTQGFNPVGVEVVAVPLSTVAVAYKPYDRYFYIATAAGVTTIAIQGGPTITLQASTSGQQVFLPAGKTMTPTYANPPTWVVEST